MSPNLSLILPQSRNPNEFSPFAGKYYYFPETSLRYFSGHTVEFVFSENTDNDKTIFYGSGKISKTFSDPRNNGFHFGEIFDYKTFTNDVTVDELITDVQEISAERLEEICLDGGIKLNFRADAHLIKVLGEQLIGSEKVGILELIKNAIDATASVNLESVGVELTRQPASRDYGEKNSGTQLIIYGGRVTGEVKIREDLFEIDAENSITFKTSNGFTVEFFIDLFLLKPLYRVKGIKRLKMAQYIGKYRKPVFDECIFIPIIIGSAKVLNDLFLKHNSIFVGYTKDFGVFDGHSDDRNVS